MRSRLSVGESKTSAVPVGARPDIVLQAVALNRRPHLEAGLAGEGLPEFSFWEVSRDWDVFEVPHPDELSPVKLGARREPISDAVQPASIGVCRGLSVGGLGVSV